MSTPVSADLAQAVGSSGAFYVYNSLVENVNDAAFVINESRPNVMGADPALGALGDNGGPTETMLPAETSPAIDKGAANGLQVDQRDLPRTTGAGTDIGSVELQPPTPPPPPADKPPKIKNLRVVPDKFEASNESTPLNRAAKGAKIKLTLSEDARVNFRVKKAKSTPGKNPPKLPRAFRRDLVEGKNTVDFTGKVGERLPFKPGKYKIVARAKDVAGQKSKKVRAPFRIVR